MKMEFTAPELDIVRFSSEDVITTSPMTNGTNLNGDEWGAATGDWNNAG